MAIDCSKTVNFLREYKRMCDSYEHCVHCAFNDRDKNEEVSCDMYCIKHPEIAVEDVQKWSDEHPVRTRLDDLKEKHPNVPLDGDGLPNFTPSVLGYCWDCLKCRCWDKPGTGTCWHEPVDGGATGKAVE